MHLVPFLVFARDTDFVELTETEVSDLDIAICSIKTSGAASFLAIASFSTQFSSYAWESPGLCSCRS